MKVKRGWRRASSRKRARPVERLSTAVTACPSDSRTSTRFEPMKPEPPVTSTRISGATVHRLPGRSTDGKPGVADQQVPQDRLQALGLCGEATRVRRRDHDA